MRLRVRAGDRETEAVARLAAAAGEAVEDPPLEVLGDAGARVLDRDPEVPVALLRDDPDRRRAVADRVRHQVRDDALEHERIDDGGEIVRDVEIDRVRRGQGAVDDVGEGRLQHDRPRLDGDGARVETREVEQLLEQRPETLALLDADAQQLLAQLLVQVRAPLGQRLEYAVDGGRRRAQLVRGDGDEVQLQLVELDQLLVQLRPLDGDRDPLGDELEQLDLVVREDPRRERPHVEDAQRLAPDEQRDADHRLELLLAQDRVVDRVLVDVDHHRPRLVGDPPGEACADRDPHPDLLLDPECRARDELVRLLVEQQDGAGVGAQDVPDPGQEDVEELVHLEVGQSRVGHRLDVLDPLARGALGLEEARMLDRERGPVGHELEQLDLVLLEVAQMKRADVENASHVSLHDERDAEHRLDPLLTQDRVEDVGVVDVVEDHRPLLGGDPAREAPADRDADALLDLLLDAERRARDELVRLLVEQQDRARVYFEDLAGAVEQRREQVVEAQMRQRGVRDRLQPPDALRVGTLRPHRGGIPAQRGAKRSRRSRSGAGAPRPRARDRPRPRRATRPGSGSGRPRPGARAARGRARQP